MSCVENGGGMAHSVKYKNTTSHMYDPSLSDPDPVHFILF